MLRVLRYPLAVRKYIWAQRRAAFIRYVWGF
jgi:hypothetical protein